MKIQDDLLEDLMARAEADKTGALITLIQILIEDSAKAAEVGITLEELAAICTAGHFLGKNPDYIKALEYIMQRGSGDSDTEH